MRGIAATGLLAVGLVLAGCPSPAVTPRPVPPRPVPPETPPETPPVAPATITFARVTAPGDVPADPPPVGTWRVHMIDVGTGLSILIQGHDFALLYDAGTNDKGENPQRVLAYLAATLGASGDDLCVGKGEPVPTGRHAIDHIVLSHPHLDHASALAMSCTATTSRTCGTPARSTTPCSIARYSTRSRARSGSRITPRRRRRPAARSGSRRARSRSARRAVDLVQRGRRGRAR